VSKSSWFRRILLRLLGVKRAAPAEASPFVGEKGEMTDVPGLHTFHRAWCEPDVDWEAYRKILIPPANVEFLRKVTWWEDTTLADQCDERIRELAQFTRNEFVEAHRRNKHKYHLEVVDEADAGTVILEIALTEVVPTKAWLNAVAYAGTMMTFAKGAVAMEARLRDGGTGRVIAKFTDRRKGKRNLFGSVRDFTWYGHAKAIIREWAKLSVIITNAEADDVIEDQPPFELKPW